MRETSNVEMILVELTQIPSIKKLSHFRACSFCVAFGDIFLVMQLLPFETVSYMSIIETFFLEMYENQLLRIGSITEHADVST